VAFREALRKEHLGDILEQAGVTKVKIEDARESSSNLNGDFLLGDGVDSTQERGRQHPGDR
jgi:hypothetical protein